MIPLLLAGCVAATLSSVDAQDLETDAPAGGLDIDLGSPVLGPEVADGLWPGVSDRLVADVTGDGVPDLFTWLLVEDTFALVPGPLTGMVDVATATPVNDALWLPGHCGHSSSEVAQPSDVDGDGWADQWGGLITEGNLVYALMAGPLVGVAPKEIARLGNENEWQSDVSLNDDVDGDSISDPILYAWTDLDHDLEETRLFLGPVSGDVPMDSAVLLVMDVVVIDGAGQDTGTYGSVGRFRDVVDHDGDGVRDLVLSEGAGDTFVFPGDTRGTVTYADAPINFEFGQRTSAHVGDIDGDGFDDIVGANGEAGLVGYGPLLHGVGGARTTALVSGSETYWGEPYAWQPDQRVLALQLSDLTRSWEDSYTWFPAREVALVDPPTDGTLDIDDNRLLVVRDDTEAGQMALPPTFADVDGSGAAALVALGSPYLFETWTNAMGAP